MRFIRKNTSVLQSAGVFCTTLFILGIIVFISAFTIDDNKKAKNVQYKHIDFALPKIIGQGKPSSFCLSPQHMMNAWYDIEHVDSLQEELDLSKEPTIYYKKFKTYQFREPDSLKSGIYSNAKLSIKVDTKNELSMIKRPIWARYLFHRSFNNKTEIRQDDTLIQEVKSLPIYVANLSNENYATIEIHSILKFKKKGLHFSYYQV